MFTLTCYGYLTTLEEWISSEAFRAGTDWNMIVYNALSKCATGSGAWIYAFE